MLPLLSLSLAAALEERCRAADRGKGNSGEVSEQADGTGRDTHLCHTARFPATHLGTEIVTSGAGDSKRWWQKRDDESAELSWSEPNPTQSSA